MLSWNVVEHRNLPTIPIRFWPVPGLEEKYVFILRKSLLFGSGWGRKNRKKTKKTSPPDDSIAISGISPGISPRLFEEFRSIIPGSPKKIPGSATPNILTSQPPGVWMVYGLDEDELSIDKRPQDSGGHSWTFNNNSQTPAKHQRNCSTLHRLGSFSWKGFGMRFMKIFSLVFFLIWARVFLNSLVLGDGNNPTFNDGNRYNGYINPYGLGLMTIPYYMEIMGV